MRVHLREANVRHRRGLERSQHVITACAAGPELFEKLDGFSGRHVVSMSGHGGRVTREVTRSAVMMPKQPMAVLKQIQDDEDIERENHQHPPRKLVQQFIELDRHKEHGFPNRQPPSP